MSELVLRDDLLDSPRWGVSPAPFKDPLERGVVSDGESKVAEASVGETSAIDQNQGHTGSYVGGAPDRRPYDARWRRQVQPIPSWAIGILSFLARPRPPPTLRVRPVLDMKL